MTVQTFTPLTLLSWQFISVSFTITAPPFSFQSIILAPDGVTLFWTEKSERPASPIIFETEDKVIIGGPNGFVGQLSQFKIYNPGAQQQRGKYIFYFHV